MGSKGYKLNYCIIFYMDKKYINFYKKFILQTKTFSDGGVSLNSYGRVEENSDLNK